MIPDDNDFKAGRKREEAPKDTSNILRQIRLIEDDDEENNETTNEATNTKVNKLIDMNEAMNEYVTIHKKFKAVWKEKLEKHLMVGYAKNHSNDTYRMYNPVTRRVSQTRDVGT